MKRHFVKTENYTRLLAAVEAMKQRGSLSACLCLVEGQPGVGKTRNVSAWGAGGGVVLVKGHVGMSLSGLRWKVSEQLGIKHRGNATAEVDAQIAALREHGTPIVFDEAQYGLAMKNGAVRQAGIEYLRDVAERAQTYVLLVVHESEVRGFSETAHIRTRIAYRCRMTEASEADTARFVQECCEVPVGEGVAAILHAQSQGRYRLLENAVAVVEALAKNRGLAKVEAADLKGLQLIVDHEASLVPKVIRSSKGAAR
ncbi:MAG: ATP-binding protein [Pseudomonadota bacterium]